MLLEALEYLLTPCPGEARRLGYLKEAVAIRARHARCRREWGPHLENTREVVRDAARACPGRDTVLVLGSGALLDVPVEELAASFRQVVLADLVHPLTARWRVRSLPNVRLDTVDLTGLLPVMAAGRPIPAKPSAPDLYRGLSPDLTVSANLLSQLPLAPRRYARQNNPDSGQADLDDLSRALIEAHLTWLSSLGGRTCLVSDTAWLDGDSRVDPLHGLAPPKPRRSWTWRVAPRPEAWPDRDVLHEVAAWYSPG